MAPGSIATTPFSTIEPLVPVPVPVPIPVEGNWISENRVSAGRSWFSPVDV